MLKISGHFEILHLELGKIFNLLWHMCNSNRQFSIVVLGQLLSHLVTLLTNDFPDKRAQFGNS